MMFNKVKCWALPLGQNSAIGLGTVIGWGRLGLES